MSAKSLRAAGDTNCRLNAAACALGVRCRNLCSQLSNPPCTPDDDSADGDSSARPESIWPETRLLASAPSLPLPHSSFCLNHKLYQCPPSTWCYMPRGDEPEPPTDDNPHGPCVPDHTGRGVCPLAGSALAAYTAADRQHPFRLPRQGPMRGDADAPTHILYRHKPHWWPDSEPWTDVLAELERLKRKERERQRKKKQAAQRAKRRARKAGAPDGAATSDERPKQPFVHEHLRGNFSQQQQQLDHLQLRQQQERLRQEQLNESGSGSGGAALSSPAAAAAAGAAGSAAGSMGNA